jgi:hypothetical protein
MRARVRGRVMGATRKAAKPRRKVRARKDTSEDGRDPFAELARMTREDPRVSELLESLAELAELRGREGIEDWVRAMEEIIAQKRRDQFRGVKGGRKPEASA